MAMPPMVPLVQNIQPANMAMPPMVPLVQNVQPLDCGLFGYSCLCLIGEGTFGSCFLVRKGCRNYALKKINLQTAEGITPTFIRAQKEISTMKELRHINIVLFEEAYLYGLSVYIIMEYCDGGDLNKKIYENPEQLFLPDIIKNWFKQISVGIHFIHAQKVIHRDIKPQNIFLTKAGTLKLGDFGIAKNFQSFVSMSALSPGLSTIGIGTPAYMAPEVFTGPHSFKSDIWSAGCVFYEIATKEKNSILPMSHRTQQILSSSPLLYDLLTKMLQRNPSLRAGIVNVLNHGFLRSPQL